MRAQPREPHCCCLHPAGGGEGEGGGGGGDAGPSGASVVVVRGLLGWSALSGWRRPSRLLGGEMQACNAPKVSGVAVLRTPLTHQRLPGWDRLNWLCVLCMGGEGEAPPSFLYGTLFVSCRGGGEKAPISTLPPLLYTEDCILLPFPCVAGRVCV